MIVSIQPVTVGDITTDIAIVNLAVGESTIAVSLFPAVEVDGAWVKVDGAAPLGVVGMDTDPDVDALLTDLGPAVAALVAGRGL